MCNALQSELGIPCPQFVLESLVFLLGCKGWHQGTTTTYGSRLTGVSYQCSRWKLYAVTVVIKNLLLHYQSTSLWYECAELVHFVQFLVSANMGSSLLHRVFNIPCLYERVSYADSTSSDVQMLWNAALEMLAGLTLTRGRTKVKAIGRSEISCPKCGESPSNAYTSKCCDTKYCYICALELNESSSCLECGSKPLVFKI